jgi:hypothetical protein
MAELNDTKSTPRSNRIDYEPDMSDAVPLQGSLNVTSWLVVLLRRIPRDRGHIPRDPIVNISMVVNPTELTSNALDTAPKKSSNIV